MSDLRAIALTLVIVGIAAVATAFAIPGPMILQVFLASLGSSLATSALISAVRL